MARLTGVLNADRQASVAMQQVRRRGDPILRNQLRRRVEVGDIRLLPERVAGADDDRMHLSDGTPVESALAAVVWPVPGGSRLGRCDWRANEQALHLWGPSGVPWLRWTGLPWQNRLQSAIIDGVRREARRTVDPIRAALAGSGTGVAA